MCILKSFVHVRDRAATGVGFLQETSPGLNKQMWLLYRITALPQLPQSPQPPPDQHIPVPSQGSSPPLLHRGFAS